MQAGSISSWEALAESRSDNHVTQQEHSLQPGHNRHSRAQCKRLPAQDIVGCTPTCVFQTGTHDDVYALPPLLCCSHLDGESPYLKLRSNHHGTPYEVLRDHIASYMAAHPDCRLYITGHSLGGALAVVFAGAFLHEESANVS